MLKNSKKKPGNIVLIGFMASGKTAVGRKLASRLKMGFIDMDLLIESQEGMKISDIFRLKGEPYFRNLEKSMIKSFQHLKNVVISTGGGVVKDSGNRRILRRMGKVIYLDTSPEAMISRLKKSEIDKRPLLRGEGSLIFRIKKILEPRIPLYRRCAHCIIETSKMNLNQVVNRVMDCV